MILYLFFALVCGCVVGAVLAWVYVAQEEYSKRLDLQAQINTLNARDLPPRVLEVWIKGEGARGVYMGSIDADLAVEALSLVGAGTRAFSEAGLSGVLTRRQLHALRAELIERGFAEWNTTDRRQGIIWTPEGQELLETCKNQAVRARAYTRHTAKQHPRVGVGEGNYA